MNLSCRTCRLFTAASAASGLATCVSGDDILGDALRVFEDNPLLSGPLVRQLCEADCVYEQDFALHQEKEHAGESEYRKRVLFLMERGGRRPITAQEKRIMIQKFAHFQQFSRPGSGSHIF